MRGYLEQFHDITRIIEIPIKKDIAVLDAQVFVSLPGSIIIRAQIIIAMVVRSGVALTNASTLPAAYSPKIPISQSATYSLMALMP
jgi:hypothetical protein